MDDRPDPGETVGRITTGCSGWARYADGDEVDVVPETVGDDAPEELASTLGLNQ